MKNAVDSAVKDGLRVVYTDESGNVYHSDTIEVATARAVRTGVSQACSEITDKRMEEMDWDIILVSAHLGARYGDGGENHTNHFWWQGKFYSRTGREKKFPLFEVCGEGKVQGFAGPNCRHNKGPGDGVNNPFEKFDSEENKKAYDLSQRQRLLERRIRKSKSDILALRTARDSAKTDELRDSFDREYQRKSALLQKQNRAYNEFCEQNGLKRLQDRLRIANWDRKQAAAATAAARKFSRLTEAKENAILNAKKLIGTDEFPLRINSGNQNKHIATSHSYNEAEHKSVLFGDAQTALDLFERYHGTGEYRLTKKLEWTHKEFVTASEDIGVTYDPDTGEYITTNRFAIHYGKKGWHIVPVKRGKE